MRILVTLRKFGSSSSGFGDDFGEGFVHHLVCCWFDRLVLVFSEILILGIET